MKIKKMLTTLATVMMFMCLWNVTVYAEDEKKNYAPSYDETTKTVVGAPEVGTLIPAGTVFSGANTLEDIAIVIKTYDTEEKAKEGVDYTSTFLWSGDEETIKSAGPNGNPEGGWIVSEVYYIEEVMEWGDVLNRIYIEGYANVSPTVIDSVNLSVNWDKIGYFRIGKILPKTFEGLVDLKTDSCESTCDFGLYLKVNDNHVKKGYVTKKNYQNALDYSDGWLEMSCLKSSYRVAATDEFCYRFDMHASDYHVFSYTDNTNIKDRVSVVTEGVSVNSAIANYNGGEDNVCIVMLHLGTAQNIVDRAGIKAEDIYVGWKKFGDKWCYFDENGNQTYKKWIKTAKGWCYIDADGYMATEKWVEDSNGTCYVGADGYMVKKQWIYESWGDCRYVGENGYLATKTWIKDEKGWRYLDRWGWVVSDAWIEYDGHLYCIGVDGYMVTEQWMEDSKGWRYVGEKGYVLTNQRVADSQGICFTGTDGYIVYGKWVQDEKDWSYVNSNGYIVMNKWMKDSKGWCYLGEDGYIVYNKWVKDSYGWCYVGSDGYMVSNKWVYSGAKWYYMDASGYMVTGWQKIGNTWYYFKSNGEWVS